MTNPFLLTFLHPGFNRFKTFEAKLENKKVLVSEYYQTGHFAPLRKFPEGDLDLVILSLKLSWMKSLVMPIVFFSQRDLFTYLFILNYTVQHGSYQLPITIKYFK